MSKPALSRRKILLGAAGAVALIGAGATWRVTRLPEDAVRPWKHPADDRDVRLFAFRHAILAPNPHNRQPWEIRLVGTDQAILTCDLNRRLPETDPFDRQITIGFGCFIEIAAIAASQRGYRIDVAPFPNGAPEMPARLDRRPIARLTFVKDEAIRPDPLFDAVRTRRSAKVSYDLARPVTAQALAAMSGIARNGLKVAYAADAAILDPLRKLCQQAWDIEYKTPKTWRESVDLIRVGSSEVNANPDGITLKGPFFETLAVTLGTDWVRAQAAIPGSSASASTVKRYTDLFIATPALIWISTSDNSRANQLEAGRAYVRQNLIATSLGLSMQPVSQALQEYPEMAESFAQMRKLCGVGAQETLQMLARLGYAATDVGPTPRWPLEAKIRA